MGIMGDTGHTGEYLGNKLLLSQQYPQFPFETYTGWIYTKSEENLGPGNLTARPWK